MKISTKTKPQPAQEKEITGDESSSGAPLEVDNNPNPDDEALEKLYKSWENNEELISHQKQKVAQPPGRGEQSEIHLI